jgi:hypothetical protein
MNWKIIALTIIILSTKTYAETKCIAHRGNNIKHIENTFRSFKSSYELGAHGVELDIRHTKDGIGIVFHDSRPKRLLVDRPGKKCIRHKKIKKQNFVDINSNCQYKNGDSLLTLEEFLINTVSWDIWKFFEFKDTPSNRTLALLKKYLTSFNKIKFISFKARALKTLLNKFKLRLKKETHFLKLYYFWVPGKPKWTPNFPFHSYWLFSKRILRLNKYYSLGLWVIDDIDTIKWAKKMNVDFITTNDPFNCLLVNK